MWFRVLSGLYPRNPSTDPVPARLRTLALVAWFTWFTSWGWMLFDLLDGVPIVQIFSGQDVPIDLTHVEAVLPGWLLRLAIHFLVCLGLHVAQLVHATNLPYAKLRTIFVLARTLDEAPSQPELLSMLLDQEAGTGGFQLATVHAFAHHADLTEWPARKRVLSTWLRLQLTQLDAVVHAGHDIIDFEGRRERVQDLSMRMQVADQILRKPPPTVI